MEAVTLGDTLGQVEAEALLDALADTLAEMEPEKFNDSGCCGGRFTGRARCVTREDNIRWRHLGKLWVM